MNNKISDNNDVYHLVDEAIFFDTDDYLEIRLIKQDSNQVLYSTMWNENEKVIVYSGIAGDIGEQNEIKLSSSQKAQELIKELVKVKINEGFRSIKKDELTELIVQYRNKNNESKESIISDREYFRYVVFHCLFWTGNGYCAGGAMGTGVSQLFSYVLNVHKAVPEIIEELENEQGLEGIKIVYYEPETDNYITLYQGD